MPIPVAITAAAPFAGKALATGATAIGATVVGLKAQQYARRQAQATLENAELAVEAVREARQESKDTDAQERKVS